MQALFRAFWQLLRGENLLMLALIAFLAKYFIVAPALDLYRYPSALNLPLYCLFVLAILCVAAAGYIINDYYDVKIDKANRRDRNQVDKVFSKQFVLNLHIGLNVTGLLLGFAVGYAAGNYRLGGLFMLVALLLWLYSKYLKKWLIIGNVTIAFLAGLMVLIIGLYETPVALAWIGLSDDAILKHLAQLVFGPLIAYALFAFLITWIREIIKDLQDIQGDATFGASTVPIVFGEKFSKFLIIILILALVRVLLGYQQLFIVEQEMGIVYYIAILVEFPLLTMAYMVFMAKSNKDYAWLSTAMKLIMLAGILSMLFKPQIL